MSWKSVGDFTLAWIWLAVTGGGTVQRIIKGVIFSLASIYALSDSTKLDIHFLTKTDDGMSEMILFWQPTMGGMLFVSVLVIWLAVAFAIIWERSGRFILRLADKIEPTDEGRYLLTVVNDGHGEALARIFVTDAIHVYRLNNEERRESILPHRVEVRWADYDPEKREQCPISLDHPGRAIILFNERYSNCDWISVGGILKPFPLLNLESFMGCLLWVKVVVKDQNGKSTDKWFLLTLDESKLGRLCQCVAETPPKEVVSAMQK